LKRKEYLTKDYIVNYEGRGKGERKFNSSTFFIKDEKGNLHGFLCVNSDITDFLEFKEQFGKMEKYFNQSTAEHSEEISTPISSMAETVIQEVINNHNISVTRMKKGEKIEVVRTLQDRGIFDIKGGTSEAAKQLKVSETTLYRYLKEIN
jgi:predicted transcriptional regulator YheO